MSERVESVERDAWVMRAMWFAGGASAIASWSGWAGLAILAGWKAHLSVFGWVDLRVAWLVPITVDVYALAGFRVWLLGARWVTTGTRLFAQVSTITAVAVGIVANIIFHEMETRGIKVPDTWVVVSVAGLPTLMLGAIAHMAGLLMRDQRAELSRREEKVEREKGEAGGGERDVDTEGIEKLYRQSEGKPALLLPSADALESAPVIAADTLLPLPSLLSTVGMSSTAKFAEELGPSLTMEALSARAPHIAERPAERPIERAPSRAASEHAEAVKAAIPEWRERTVKGSEISLITGVKGAESIQKVLDVLYPDSPTALRRAAKRADKAREREAELAHSV